MCVRLRATALRRRHDVVAHGHYSRLESARVKRISQTRGAARELVESLRDERADVIFGIGDLCEEFRVSPRTLLFYETKGLLAPRRINSLRVYTRRARALLALILRAKAIGSKLSEIKHLLDIYCSTGVGR